ncbi:snoRNA-binding rRNA-processing protein utp10, partial [Dipsacomyces acuminosporus]
MPRRPKASDFIDREDPDNEVVESGSSQGQVSEDDLVDTDHGAAQSSDESEASAGQGSEEEDDYFVGDGDGEEEEEADDSAAITKPRAESTKSGRLLSEKDILAAQQSEKRSGVVYMSRVPPFMKPIKVRHLLEKYAEIGRIYLAQEDDKRRKKRVKSGGNRKKQFVEGWIEFTNKKYAKAVAQMLNSTAIGGKKHGFYHDDLWNLKYLPKFKWRHLTEQLANEKASKEQRLENEISQSRRELDAYLKSVDRAKKMSSIKSKRQAKIERGEQVKPMEDVVRNVYQRDVVIREADPSSRKRRKVDDSVASVLDRLFKLKHTDRNISTERAHKIRASFLFDGRQAADMDNQTIFDIGRDGLNELRQINSRFDVYATTLFSDAVRDMDRVLQTKEENKKLDESIRSFLFQLAPHFLTKPAGKALEWLIRRFRIQEFNAKDILAAIIPYHETKAFLTMLTIITFDTADLDVFGFLVTQRKARRLLDRATLMAQCHRDRSLMAFICNAVFDAAKSGLGYPGLHSFYAMVMSQYVGQLAVFDDGALQLVLPYVLDGLSLRSTDSQLAAYMVLGSVATRVTFTKEAFEKVLCAVAQQPADVRAMTMCLVQLLQTQASIVSGALSPRFLGLLSRHSRFPKELCDLASSFDIELFMQLLLKSLAHYAFDDEKLSQFLSGFIHMLPVAAVPALCETLVDEYIARGLASKDAASTAETIDLLQLRFVQQLEDAIGAAAEGLASRSDLTRKQQEAAHKLLYQLKMRVSSADASGVVHLKETATTLYLSINHADSGIRLVAAKALRDIVNGKNKEFSLSKDDSSSLILERLTQDDSQQVLKVILSLPLASIIEASDLIPAIASIIDSERVPLDDLCTMAINHLLAIDTSADKSLYGKVAAVLFPYLLDVASTHLVTKTIFSSLPGSNFGKQSGWLSCLATPRLSADNAASGQHNKRIADLLAPKLAEEWKELADAKDGLWAAELRSKRLVSKLSAIIIGTHAICHFADNKDADGCIAAASAVVGAVTSILSSSDSLKSVQLESNMLSASTQSSNWLSILGSLSSAKLELASASAKVAIGALSIILNLLPEVAKLRPNQWFVTATPAASARTGDAETRYRALLRSTFTSIISRPDDLTDADGILIGRMLSVCMGSEWAQFLASMWTLDISPLARSRCLLSFQALLKHSSSESQAVHTDYQNVLPSLIASLSDDDARVRGAAAACIHALKSAYPPASDKQARGRKGGASGEQDIYMYDAFYGPTSDKLQYLPTAVVARLVDQLALLSDLIQSDAWAIRHELGLILNKGVCSKAPGSLKLNSQGRTSIAAFLLSHVVATDNVLPRFQVGLLSVMELVSSTCFLEQMFPLIASHARQLEQQSSIPASGHIDFKLLHALFGACFRVSNAQQLADGTQNAFWAAFLDYVSGVPSVPAKPFAEWNGEMRSKAYLQQVAFEFLTPELVASLGAQAITAVTSSLLGAATKGNSYFVPGSSSVSLRDLFSTIPLDANVVADELSNIAAKLSKDDGDTARSGKRAKGSEEPRPSADVLPELSTLLEYIQCSNLLSTNPIIAPALFSLLLAFVSDLSVSSSGAGFAGSASADASSDSTTKPQLVSIEYTKQLILAMLTRIFDEANKTDTVVDESVIRVDVIVQSIRTSTSPQTHNQTLLLLAAVATQHPQVVLHHVMAIFTFMGANVLRQDDKYSFHVIEQTLEKIIPPLVSSKSAQPLTKAEEVAQAGPVLRVFVDALSHIPRHRRMTLFTTLVRTMGVRTYAPAVFSLLLEKNVAKLLKSSKTEASAKETEDIHSFTSSLAQEFSAIDQVHSAELLVRDIIALPAEKQQQQLSRSGEAGGSDQAALSELYIDYSSMNNKQLRTYRLVVLDFVHRLLTSRQFESKFSTVAPTIPSVSAQLTSATATLLELLAKLGGQYEQLVSQQRLATPASSRVWKQSVHLAYSVLDDINMLMDRRTFVHTVIKLLGQDDLKARRKVMALANTKLAEFDTRLVDKESKDIDSMLELVSPILAIAIEQGSHGSNEREAVTNKQAALLCIATAAKKFAVLRPVFFTDVVKKVSGKDCLGSKSPSVASSALVALAVLCSELGSRLIPNLPMYLPTVLKHLHSVSSKFTTASAGELALMISALSAMEAIVENMPAFLAPSLAPLFACLFNPAIRSPEDTESEASDEEMESDADSDDSSASGRTKAKKPRVSELVQLRGKAQAMADAVLSALAKNIPPRQLLPAQFSYYQKEATKQGAAVIVPFVEFVGKTGGSLQRTHVLQFYKPLFKL